MKNINRTILSIAIATLFTTAAVAAQGSVKTEYKRLLALRVKLAKIPMEKLDREPHKSFVRRNKKDIVYSDPAGQWFVRSDRFWDLAKKNKTNPLADDIAWSAAENPLPGECEGYVNCYVYNANATLGEYLRMFPNGAHRKEALKNFVEWLQPMTDPAEGNYDGPTDASDKTELKKMIAELQTTFAKINVGTDEALRSLKALEERYK